MAMTALEQFVKVLEKTQWWTAEGLAAHQRKPLEKLVRHAYEKVPFYRDRLAVLFRRNGTINWDRWNEVPLMSKDDVQDNPDQLLTNDAPDRHGAVTSVFSSGSTGRPTEIWKTAMAQVADAAVWERNVEWHQIDCTLKLASIRALPLGSATYPEGLNEDVWPNYVHEPAGKGPHALLNINTPIHKQAEWLCRQKPEYLLTFPSNAAALAAFIADDPKLGPEAPLSGIWTGGEILLDDVRTHCAEVFNAKIVDWYNAIEIGPLAIQCPDYPHYHVQSEIILTEILNSENMPCEPSERGRVFATPLYNYATPLIRYDMNDFAIVGEPCACGRGLPVLARVVGRSRNLFRFPDGTTLQPDFKTRTFTEYLKPRQWQVAQTGPLEIEVRLVASGAKAEMDTDGMTAYIHKLLRPDLTIKYRFMQEIPPSPGGKHEDYLCELTNMDDGKSRP